MKILVVDDEEHIRTLLGELLEMNGYDCALASSAADARDLLKNQEVQLIIHHESKNLGKALLEY